MPPRAALSPEETRVRILEVAEEHFRRVGYAKTAIADIAGALSMSPANVYRFFASKAEIKEAIAHKLLDASHRMMLAEADAPVSASDRLLGVVLAIHRFNKQQFVAERRIHEMVEVAMEENWDVIQAHLETIVGIFAGIIRDGISAGEFPPQDALEAALTLQQILPTVCHPTLIAQYIDTDLEAQARRIVRYFIRSLKAPA